MNKNEKVLIDILSLVIRGQKVKKIEAQKIDWDVILKEAKNHNVDAFLYVALKELPIKSDFWNNFITSLKNISMTTASRQIQAMYGLSKILYKLKEAGVPVVALKGIVLKDLYPYPELRTMGDADLLIPLEYFDLSKNILKLQGYYEYSSNSKETCFTKNGFLSIELHRTLLNNKENKTPIKNFEKQVWENIKSTTVCGVEVYTLGYVDELIHICLHMVSHILGQGFGLRQLCDFVLYTEAVFDIIDWKEFCIKAEELEIDYFVAAIFQVANQLLGLKIPELSFKYKHKQKTIDSLIFDILRSGTFGHSVIRWKYSKDILSEINNGDIAFWLRPLRVIKVIASRSQRVSEKYTYAKKYSFLMPIAWVNYLIDRTYYFILSINAAKRRTKLFNNLNLK